MSDAELWAAWRLWMAVAGVVVLVAAALLVTIWLTARRILSEALRIVAAAERIRTNTAPIWQLQASNEVAADILATVNEIQSKVTALADAVEGRVVGR